MKKYITILSFIVCFAASFQVANAQRNSDNNSSTLTNQVNNSQQLTKKKAFTPEVTAKQRTHEIHQLVELNGEQQKSIFYMLVDAENNLDAIENSSADINTKQVRKREIMKYIDDKLKVILTPDQYNTYAQSQQNTMNRAANKSKQ